MKTIEKAVILGFVLTLLLSITKFSSHCANIENKVLRLHILANSNSQEDQNLKLKIRDKVIEYASDEFTDIIDKNDAKKFTYENINTIQKIAQEEVYNNGYNYPVYLELINTNFNTRKYKEVTLPAGNYDALRIIIGNGKGENWWCVMFPPMCLPAARESEELEDILNDSEINIVTDSEKYEIRFKVVEYFEKIKNIIA